MNRTEFLDTLRSQLSGQMHEGKVAAHVRYYEDYIQSQVRSGRDEQQVLDELGDPRLIARTLLDTDVDNGQLDLSLIHIYGGPRRFLERRTSQQSRRLSRSLVRITCSSCHT